MKRLISVCLVVMTILIGTSCQLKPLTGAVYGVKNKPIQYAFDAFDTQCSISLYGNLSEEVAGQYFFDMKKLVDNYDKTFSKTNEASEIYEINHRTGDSVMISDETARIFEIASSLYDWSKGKFDISAGTLVDLWDVKNRKTLPTLDEINEARSHTANFKYNIKYDVVEDELRKNQITFYGDKLTQYDLGGLIKGYCADALKEMLSRNDDIKACIVNLGGSVLCTGEVDGRAGNAFKVGIFKPFSGNDIIDTIDVKNRNVITSGNYQRYFKVDGDERVYHHIIDPTTGYPTNNGLDSVTIVSENGLLGDYLSTACMLLGEEDSKKLIDFASGAFNDNKIQATFVHSDGKITKYPENLDLTK